MISTQVHIAMQGGGQWDIGVAAKNLEAAGGLPSGKIFTLERRTGDVQVQQVMIRPYYRRMINEELHIFAVQVKPNEEIEHGKSKKR